MIEIYVGISLLGLGYILNQNRPVKSNPVKQLNVNELPSSTNTYDSNFVKTAKKIESQLVNKKFTDASNAKSNVIPRDNLVLSQLAGIQMPATEFKHNNMKPFYRGSLTHAKLDSNTDIERLTGVPQYYQPKREVESLFRPEKNFGNVTGMPGTAEFVQGRVEAPKARNNILPFDQVKVGPGINQGYNSNPSGGYTQYATRDFVMPKQVDDLRTANKPKVTYKGRIVDGQKGSVRGSIGVVNRNRVPTSFEKTTNDYLPTSGAYSKEKMQPEVDAKYVSRQDVSAQPYSGIAINKTVGNVNRSKQQEPLKEQLGAFGITNLSLTRNANKRDDYGKASVQVYDTERSVTSTKTYQGNIVSLIKSLTAPIEDLIKVSRKEYTVEAPREYGNLQTSFPSKQTVHDATQVPRTSIKETLIHDSTLLNLKGATKLSVYDPSQVLRTTHKETMLHDSQSLNLKSAGGQGPVLDPDATTKTTGRQTIDPISSSRNIASSMKKSIAIDENDIARTTVKETDDVFAPRNFGNVNRSENFQGSYANEDYDAPDTQRHVLSQQEYHTNPNRQTGDAYQVVDKSFTPNETQKQLITDNSEYYGNAGDKITQKPMSYEDVYNACFNELREETLQKREPTQTSVKVFNGAEDILIASRKNEYQQPTENIDRIVNIPLDSKEQVNMTKAKNEYEEVDRLEADLLDAFRNNEFTQSLQSIA